ncbi:MAG: sugar ABC transporter permease [Bifidobacteriaceae bacterium]|nr:sugar ABC transporter permease [Bifidobacteriaceae bacterium]
MPIVVTLYLSFTEFNILQSPKWIGLENYTRAFGDERFYKSLGTTFYLTFIGVPIGLGFGLATAMILNLRRMPARGFARALAYVPAIIPVVVTAYLFRWILNGRHGLLNTVLGWFGISAPNWLLDPTWMRPAVILISLWAVGGTTVIYLAALRSVPTDLYEAAELDGCGPVRRFIHVTWPSILPVTVFQLIVGLLANLQAFDVPYLLGSGDFNMTIGGPGETWLTYAIYIYHVAFGYFRMGYAAALAWLLFLIALVLTVIILRLTREVDNAE